MHLAVLAVFVCFFACSGCQCPPQLPDDSICSSSAWSVSRSQWTLAGNLDIGTASLTVNGTFLQLPNATLTISWDGMAFGRLIANDALLSGFLRVGFLQRPPKSLKLAVISAANIVGTFQELSALKNYSSRCDELELSEEPVPATVTLAVARRDSCRESDHTPLIVVCSLCAVAVFAVIIYLVITECAQKIRSCFESD